MANNITLQDSHEVVNLVVGGNNFCFSKEDVERFPDSYFAHFLKDEWKYNKSDNIYIDRDGWLFRFVFAYIVSGSLEFRPTTFNLEELMAIRREADFFNLPGMIAKCDERIIEQVKVWCRSTATCTGILSRFIVEPEYSPDASLLSDTLNSAIRPPVAVTSSFELPISMLNAVVSMVQSTPHSHNFVDVTSLFNMDLRVGTHGFWPVQIKEGEMLSCQTKIYLVLTGGYHRGRMPMFSTARYLLKGYMIYIPSTCVYTGGKITAVGGGGQMVSIDKAGEVMCLQAGMKYIVETVTSGSLFVMETEIYVESGSAPPLSSEIEWKRSWEMCTAPRDKQSVTEQCTALYTALITELISYPSGVIICLTTLYPITHSPDPENNHIYTDPDRLQGLDDVLYNTLSERFTVSVVTVFLCRTNPDSVLTAPSANATASITASATTNVSSTTANIDIDNTLVGCLVDSALPDIEGVKYKIVPVVYGYGESFRVGDQKQQLGTLLTGLLVMAK